LKRRPCKTKKEHNEYESKGVKERLDDIKSMDDYKRVLYKLEEEKSEYFKKIELISNLFISCD
jgi:hypothetical protein